MHETYEDRLYEDRLQRLFLVHGNAYESCRIVIIIAFTVSIVCFKIIIAYLLKELYLSEFVL